MCYCSGKLYIVTGSSKFALQVYNVNDQDTITLLDTLHLQYYVNKPYVDRQSDRVYIPCYANGVLVVEYDGSKLLIVTTLKCVRYVTSLAIVSQDTLYVSADNSKTICLVDAIKDRVIQRLQRPRGVPQFEDIHAAFLGETLLVCRKYPSLSSSVTTKMFIYQHGPSTPGKVIPGPQGVGRVCDLTTDNHSSFLLTGGYPRSVYVLDISGDVTHTIPIVTDSDPVNCTVVGEKLWVGCDNGEIIVMSSQ